MKHFHHETCIQPDCKGSIYRTENVWYFSYYSSGINSIYAKKVQRNILAKLYILPVHAEKCPFTVCKTSVKP